MHIPNFDPLLASGAVTVDLDPTVFAHFLLFTAFVVIMKDLLFDPLLRVFEERERRTAGAIAKAREMDEQALELKQEYDSKIEEIRRDASVDRERIRTMVKKLEAELMDDARQAVGTHLEYGMTKVQQEVGAIRKDLERQQTSLAAEIASRVLGRDVKASEVRP
jgi:F-type H+-transporting ATPase subunit b